MGGYLSIPILAVAVVIQAAVMPELRILGGMPDLVLLLVLAYSLIKGFERGLVWAIVGGVLQDLISAVPLGTTSFALVVVIGAAAVAFGEIGPRSLLLPPLAAAGGTIVHHSVTLVVLLVTGRPVPVLSSLAYVTLPSTVYNLLFMLVVYRIVGVLFASPRTRRVQSL